MAQKYYVYNVIEAICKKMLTDSASSITGPTYGAAMHVPGIQSVSVNLNRDVQNLLGDGKILGVESSITEIPIQLEIAQRDQEFEALLYGMAAWRTPTEMNLAFTGDSSPNYVGLWLRTDRVGANGKDVVIYIPKFQAAQQQMQQQQRQFRTNQISGGGVFTASKVEVLRDGVVTTESLAFQEQYRDTAAALLSSSDSTAPTITTANITGHVVGADIVIDVDGALNPNTVNKYTALLKTGATIGSGTLVACTVALNTAGTQITINPTAALTGATSYNVQLTTYIEDLAGNAFAALSGITVATA